MARGESVCSKKIKTQQGRAFTSLGLIVIGSLTLKEIDMLLKTQDVDQ
jgi:hypothetical protein